MPLSKDFVWNTTAGVLNASEAVIMAMVTTRCGTIEEAGILAIGFAVGNLLMTVGKAGARVFHSTDIKRIFEFKTYIRERCISILVMATIMIIYLIMQSVYRGWTGEKVISVSIICLFYMIESLEDCIWGELQRCGYLYIGGMMFSARWSGILATFTIVMSITRRLVVSLGISFVVSSLIFLICLECVRYRSYIKAATDTKDNFGEGNRIYSLLKQTFPFFLSAFCVMYLNNAPKFYIDEFLSDGEQACFGFVAMPVYMIGLVNQFVFQPYLVLISEEWNGGKLVFFRRMIRRQMLILLGIGCICIVGAASVGISFLSLFYGTDLSGYWKELVILQVAGLFLAMSGYFSVILTTMRKGNKLLFGYFVTMALSFLLMGTLTGRYGILGASTGYMLLMIVLCMIDMVMYAIIIKRRTIEQFECGRV